MIRRRDELVAKHAIYFTQYKSEAPLCSGYPIMLCEILNLESAHIIPAIVRKCLEVRDRGDDAITAWGTGKPTREFLYVTDAARGILDATEELDRSEPVSLGSGAEISIRDLVETIAELTGFEGDIEWDTSKPDGQPRRKLDTSRAEEYFGWSAGTDFEDGLRRTIEWYESIRAEYPAGGVHRDR